MPATCGAAAEVPKNELKTADRRLHPIGSDDVGLGVYRKRREKQLARPTRAERLNRIKSRVTRPDGSYG